MALALHVSYIDPASADWLIGWLALAFVNYPAQVAMGTTTGTSKSTTIYLYNVMRLEVTSLAGL